MEEIKVPEGHKVIERNGLYYCIPTNMRWSKSLRGYDSPVVAAHCVGKMIDLRCLLNVDARFQQSIYSN